MINVEMVGCSFLPIDALNGKILISQRSLRKKHFPGKWETLGGNLEFGESFEECIRREVSEEISCAILGLKQMFSRAMYFEGKLYITVSFIGVIDSVPIPKEEEILDLRWISNAELEQYDFCPGDKEILARGFLELRTVSGKDQ